MVVVAIAGSFSIVHEGHIDHIQKAYKLGNWLIIITHKDRIIKKYKGIRPVTLNARIAILKGLISSLGGLGEVIVARDTDGTVTKTLREIKPDIFAKGGDRNDGNMPQSEIDVCKEIGCEIRYGVGDLLNSSTKIWRQRCQNIK